MKPSAGKGLILILAAVFLTVATVPVFADTLKPDTTAGRQKIQQLREKAQQTAEKHKQAVQDKIIQQRETVKAKLDERRLKACQNREKNVQNIMVRIASRGDKQIALFTSIAERVESFYLSKRLTISKFDALTADILSKKAAAEAAVASLKSSDLTFKCDSDDPKGTAAVFKDLMKEEIDALKAYRTSVKNLIVAVAQAQKTAVGEGGTE